MIRFIIDEAAETLAHAIVEQAAFDWIRAQGEINTYSNPVAGREQVKKYDRRNRSWSELEAIRCERLDQAYQDRGECERFLLSDWFKRLCNLSGRQLLAMLRQKNEETPFDCGGKRYHIRSWNKGM